MVLLIDNYDSFSYNLVQLVGSLGTEIEVIRNDALTVREIAAKNPSHIILSPGPGYPKDAGVCEDVVAALKGQVPILGVCLGHQAICEVFGATVAHAKRLMHGKQSMVQIDPSCPLFWGLPEQLPVARYHSLAAKREDFPDCLTVTAAATDDTGEIMAVSHRDFPVYGLQFHPESILTPDGRAIMMNFLTI
jgi:anthranilate synthase component 2